MKQIILTKDKVKRIGRNLMVEDVLWIALSASGVAFEFTGSNLEITIQGSNNALIENITYVVNVITKAKPATVKGKYIQNISLSTTMGPGIHVDQNSIDM